MLSSSTAAQFELAPDRRVDWASYCGVPGGIVVRDTIYTTVAAGSTVATINSAISACPSNQVVMLAEGLYNLSGNIELRTRSHKTLRGAGTNKTILNFTSGGITSDQYSFTTNIASLDSGYTKVLLLLYLQLHLMHSFQ